jgi:hypothetical protein
LILGKSESRDSIRAFTSSNAIPTVSLYVISGARAFKSPIACVAANWSLAVLPVMKSNSFVARKTERARLMVRLILYCRVVLENTSRLLPRLSILQPSRRWDMAQPGAGARWADRWYFLSGKGSCDEVQNHLFTRRIVQSYTRQRNKSIYIIYRP